LLRARRPLKSYGPLVEETPMTVSRPLDTDETGLVEQLEGAYEGFRWWGTRLVAAAATVALVLGLILGVVALPLRGEANAARQELDGQRLQQYKTADVRSELHSVDGDGAGIDR